MAMAELGERSKSTHRRPQNRPAEPCGEPPPWTNGRDSMWERNQRLRLDGILISCVSWSLFPLWQIFPLSRTKRVGFKFNGNFRLINKVYRSSWCLRAHRLSHVVIEATNRWRGEILCVCWRVRSPIKPGLEGPRTSIRSTGEKERERGEERERRNLVVSILFYCFCIDLFLYSVSIYI